MLHAVEHSLVVDDLAEDPDRWIVVGLDPNLIELVVLITAEDDEMAFMPCGSARGSRRAKVWAEDLGTGRAG